MLETAQENENKTVQYDANAAQSVFVDIDDDGETKKVEHRFNPHSDEHFFQFDEKRETLLKKNDGNKKIRLKQKTAAAYLWFWEQFCFEVKNYGDPEAPTPENWRELVDDDDKISAVEGLIAAQIIPNKKVASENTFVAWGRDRSINYQLEVLFNGETIFTENRLNAKTAEIVSDWRDLVGGVEFGQSETLLDKNQEMSIPATAREKVPFYDRLVSGEPVNYRGRVPAFIKLLLVNAHLGSKAQTGKKSALSATP